MNHQTRVMLLIDADNVSADVIDQAVAKVMADHGAIHVRRAYCTAESALANLKLFKAHSIRPIVNLSTGKNSTDIALAVDAVDLVTIERPDIVVVVSSDSDFAPLVIKLREKGCRVEGIGQQGKTGEDSKPVYDAFTDIEHRKSRSEASAPRKRAGAARREHVVSTPAPAAPRIRERTRGARAASQREADDVAAPAPASVPMPAPPPQEEVPASSPAPRRRRSSRTAAEAASPPLAEMAAPLPEPVPSRHAPHARPAAPLPSVRVMPDDLRRILAVLPELVRGAKMELGIATERLRSENLLAKNAPSTKLFKKYPEWFALSPDGQPNKVHYLGLQQA